MIYFCFLGYNRLNEYISHYESLDYDAKEVHNRHLRSKRSLNSNPYLNIHFFAHGKKFNLRLKRDIETFNSNLKVIYKINIIKKIELICCFSFLD